MTRVLILSDIHGNKAALDAVLADAGAADTIWCLGDMIGYGPEPSACLAWVRDHCDLVLSGNHDYAAFDDDVLAAFNPAATIAARWTRAQLSAKEIAYLASLPSRLDFEEACLAHGSPADPIWTYLLTVIDAADAFDAFPQPLCFVGHTHIPACFAARAGTILRASPVTGEPFPLARGRYIVNPGSVGQPRDRDPRAAYLWYDPDTNTATWHRVAYDIVVTQEQIRAAGLPERLAERLARGM